MHFLRTMSRALRSRQLDVSRSSRSIKERLLSSRDIERSERATAVSSQVSENSETKQQRQNKNGVRRAKKLTVPDGGLRLRESVLVRGVASSASPFDRPSPLARTEATPPSGATPPLDLGALPLPRFVSPAGAAGKDRYMHSAGLGAL